MIAAKRTDVRTERGQTMVEFALIMPVLCMVLFAIIQFGILFNDYLSLTDATRVGARKAAVSRTAANPAAVTEAAVRTAASDLNGGRSRRRRDRDGVDARRRSHRRGELSVRRQRARHGRRIRATEELDHGTDRIASSNERQISVQSIHQPTV